MTKMTKEKCIVCGKETVSVIKTDAGYICYNCYSEQKNPSKRKRKKKKTGHRFLKEECQLALLSFSKAGAKVRTLKHNFQMFRKFFFIFLFQGRSSERNLWQRREKWKLTAPFYCQNVKTSPPSFPKADAKVGLLRTSAKYIQAFFEGLRELFHN